MMTYLKNIILLPRLIGMLIHNLGIQKKYLQKTLLTDIAESKKTNDGSLTDRDFKKITLYYALAVPAIVGECFCLLRHKKMTDHERFLISYLGGLSGLLDDFFDNKTTSDEHIRELIVHPQEHNAKNSFESLIIKLYTKALEKSLPWQGITEWALQVFEAQQISRTQTSYGISAAEIEAITYRKGGVAFQFYRNALHHEVSPKEMELVYKSGAILQLENDIFDVYKDYKDGIKTMLTTERKIDNVRKKFNELFDELKRTAFETHYARKDIELFLRTLSLVLCRAYVCLDMLEKNQRKTANRFEPGSYLRKELICDMEKPANILRAIHQYSKMNIVGK